MNCFVFFLLSCYTHTHTTIVVHSLITATFLPTLKLDFTALILYLHKANTHRPTSLFCQHSIFFFLYFAHTNTQSSSSVSALGPTATKIVLPYFVLLLFFFFLNCRVYFLCIFFLQPRSCANTAKL